MLNCSKLKPGPGNGALDPANPSLVQIFGWFLVAEQRCRLPRSPSPLPSPSPNVCIYTRPMHQTVAGIISLFRKQPRSAQARLFRAVDKSNWILPKFRIYSFASARRQIVSCCRVGTRISSIYCQRISYGRSFPNILPTSHIL